MRRSRQESDALRMPRLRSASPLNVVAKMLGGTLFGGKNPLLLKNESQGQSCPPKRHTDPNAAGMSQAGDKPASVKGLPLFGSSSLPLALEQTQQSESNEKNAITPCLLPPPSTRKISASSIDQEPRDTGGIIPCTASLHNTVTKKGLEPVQRCKSRGNSSASDISKDTAAPVKSLEEDSCTSHLKEKIPPLAQELPTSTYPKQHTPQTARRSLEVSHHEIMELRSLMKRLDNDSTANGLGPDLALLPNLAHSRKKERKKPTAHHRLPSGAPAPKKKASAGEKQNTFHKEKHEACWHSEAGCNSTMHPEDEDPDSCSSSVSSGHDSESSSDNMYSSSEFRARHDSEESSITSPVKFKVRVNEHMLSDRMSTSSLSKSSLYPVTSSRQATQRQKSCESVHVPSAFYTSHSFEVPACSQVQKLEPLVDQTTLIHHFNSPHCDNTPAQCENPEEISFGLSPINNDKGILS